MADLDKLLEQLRIAEDQDDLDRLDALRQRIVDEHSDAPESVEARYRLGLSKLLRHKQAKEAEQLFLQAAQSGDQLFSPMARISYALILHSQKREQKALFELRKVVGSRKPSPQSVCALAFIVTVLRDTGASKDEVERARKQQVEQLRTLLEEVDAPEAQAQLSLQLAGALADAGEAQEAKALLSAIVKPGATVDASTLEEAKAVLAAL